MMLQDLNIGTQLRLDSGVVLAPVAGFGQAPCRHQPPPVIAAPAMGAMHLKRAR